MLLPGDGQMGSYQIARTHNQLVIDENDSPILPETMVTDPNLKVQFTYPFYGTYFRPAEAVVGKGIIVSIRGVNFYEHDYDKNVMRACVTIANGGADQTEDGIKGTYIRKANMPIGIAEHNFYRKINDRSDGNDPVVRRKGYIEVPYFANSTALAAACKYGCAYNAASQYALTPGCYLKSDANGKFVKYNSGDPVEQKIAKLITIDRTIPVEGWLQWVMWEARDRMGEQFDPYDLFLPQPTPDANIGSRVTGAPGYNQVAGRPDLNSFKGTFPSSYGYDSLYGWPAELWDAMGIPGLTDGVEMGSVDYTDTVVEYTKTYDAGTGISTIQLAHKLIAPDREGAVNPSSAHPGPSRLILYNAADLTVALLENTDYTVDRYRGIIYIKNTAGTENYRAIYTSLENQIVGVPTHLDFKGSVGAARILLMM